MHKKCTTNLAINEKFRNSQFQNLAETLVFFKKIYRQAGPNKCAFMRLAIREEFKVNVFQIWPRSRYLLRKSTENKNTEFDLRLRTETFFN